MKMEPERGFRLHGSSLLLPNKKQTVKLDFTPNHEEEVKNPYGNLFDKFLSK